MVIVINRCHPPTTQEEVGVVTCHLIDHHSRGIRGCMYVLRLLCEEMSSICVCYEDGTYTLILIHFINIVTTHSPVPFISRHTTVYTLHALIVMYRHSPIHAYLPYFSRQDPVIGPFTRCRSFLHRSLSGPHAHPLRRPPSLLLHRQRRIIHTHSLFSLNHLVEERSDSNQIGTSWIGDCHVTRYFHC